MDVYLVADSALEEDLLPRLSGVKRVSVVGAARDAVEALKGINQAKPHMVIVAVNPIDGSGIDVLSGIAGSDHRPLVYVIANGGCEKTRARCTRAGVSRYFEQAQLDRLVDTVASLAPAC